ncbi:MAG TPA: hypothetical protein VLD57_10415, partial [Blastocatellia bacterium]|nr:hypothetical protein [Blastocatellia bacterium]
MKASIHISPCNNGSHTLVLRATVLLLLVGPASLITTVRLRAQEPAVRVEMFSFRPDGYVSIENTRGNTRVETWAKEKVHVIAEKKTPTGSPLVSSELVLSSEDNRIRIECKRAGEPGPLNLTVFIPRRSHLQVTGGDSPVEVTGSVASAVVETTGGNIEYRMPASDDARVVMHSARGNVRSTLKLTSYDRAGVRSIQGRLGQGNAPIILNSQSGDISLIPAPAAPAMAVVIDLPQSSSARRPEPQHGRYGKNGDRPPDRQTGRQTAPTADTRGVDQDDPDDPNSIAAPPSQRHQRPAASHPPDRQVIISQDDSHQQSTTSGRNGPLSGPRQETRNSSGSIGVGVRVIRPDSPAGRADDSQQRTSIPDDSRADSSPAQRAPDSTYDQSYPDRDVRPAQSTAPHSRPAPDSSDSGARSRSRDSASRPRSDYGQGTSTRDDSGRDSHGEIAHAGTQPNTPPVLRRDNASDPGATAGAARTSSNNNGGEEAIVLNTSLVSLNVSVTNRSGK